MRLRRGLAGAVLLAFSATAFVVGGANLRAQTDPEPAEITRHAYFTRPITQVSPPLLFAGFPPGTVCLVAGLIGVPEVCGEDIQDIVNMIGLTQGIPIPVTPDSHLVQPVVPGTTPIGMLGGQERWASLFQFRLPTLPEGEEFASFEVVFHQDGINFALESPAFRELVFAVISQIQVQDPAVIAEVLAEVIAAELPALTETITGIEACPVLDGWENGNAQDAALDGSRLPRSDCIRGTTGRFDAAEGTWAFDLTFAAQAWTSGADAGETLANEGVIFRPLGAPNLAYGDPDLSTNFMVSLATAESLDPALHPLIRYSTRPSTAVSPGEVVPPPGTSPDVVSPGAPTAPQPGAPPLAGGPVSFQARWGDREPGGEGTLPAWVLLLLPVAVAGAYLLGESLLAAPDIVRRRPGALSRMMEQRSKLS